MGANSWTPEATDYATKAWKDGSSAGEISKTLVTMGYQISREGVLGKMTRLGLTRSKAAMGITAELQNRANMKANFFGGMRPKAPDTKPHNFSSSAPLNTSKKPMTIVEDTATPRVRDVGSRQCCWPLGDPATPDFGFCGAPRDPEAKPPYCAKHRAKAIDRNQPKSSIERMAGSAMRYG